MFYVKQTDIKELVRRVLACQEHERKEEVGIINDEGLRVEPVPDAKVKKIRWTPSGLYNPNAWRNKK